MSEHDNRALVQRGYEAFGRGDIDALLALLDDDVEWITPGPSGVPTAGRRRGRQQVAEFFQSVDSLFAIERFEPETFVSEGDRVVVLGSETTRVKATGTVLNSRWVHVFTVRDGKVAVLEEIQDMSAVAAELRGFSRERRDQRAVIRARPAGTEADRDGQVLPRGRDERAYMKKA